RQEAFDAVTSALHSAKQRLELQGGVKRLLAVRMRAVQSCLRLMIKNGMRMMEASKMAALASGFSAGWVSRSVRSWTQKYIKDRGLPSSRRGCHTKVSNVLDDPTVWAIIRSYLRSNKWSINPVKLRNFVNNELASKEAEAYAKEVMEVEMPTGLRQYIQDVILPRMQLKTKGKGFSLSAMRDLLLSEGFKPLLIKYEQPLKKKGVGRGVHCSDFVSSVHGHLVEAGKSLEYGKNHEGYWPQTCSQSRYFVLFNSTRHPGHFAVVLVDNSRGHLTYAKNALRVGDMNFNSGGSQPCMRARWYKCADGLRVSQQMVFPEDYETTDLRGKPKGMKQKYLREHCDYSFPGLKRNIPDALASVSVLTIRKWEHRAWRFIDAYAKGLDAKDAQIEVKLYSSRRYKAHRRISEGLARPMDQ
ncbi:hypothetical protein BDV98DRAFT_501471, partial [Pterulicium gracile]